MSQTELEQAVGEILIDEETLAARVLATEHVIYPLALRWWVEGKLRVDGGRVRHLDGASQVLISG